MEHLHTIRGIVVSKKKINTENRGNIMHLLMSLPTPHPPPPGDSQAFDHFILVCNIKFSCHGQFPTIAWGRGGGVGSDIVGCIMQPAGAYRSASGCGPVNYYS